MIHRVTANSKRGRQLMAQHAASIRTIPPFKAASAEQRAWNAKVEEKRQAKKRKPA